MQPVASHPAETAGLAAAVAALIAGALGVADPQVYQALIVVVGALPAVVTWLVVLVRGRRADEE